MVAMMVICLTHSVNAVIKFRPNRKNNNSGLCKGTTDKNNTAQLEKTEPTHLRAGLSGNLREGLPVNTDLIEPSSICNHKLRHRVCVVYGFTSSYLDPCLL